MCNLNVVWWEGLLMEQRFIHAAYGAVQSMLSLKFSGKILSINTEHALKMPNLGRDGAWKVLSSNRLTLQVLQETTLTNQQETRFTNQHKDESDGRHLNPNSMGTVCSSEFHKTVLSAIGTINSRRRCSFGFRRWQKVSISQYVSTQGYEVYSLIYFHAPSNAAVKCPHKCWWKRKHSGGRKSSAKADTHILFQIN